jgi:phasin family protein
MWKMATPLRRQGLHAQDSGRHLRRCLSRGPVINRRAYSRDAWRAQPCYLYQLLALAGWQSAKVAAQGAQSVAQKQREVLEGGLREAASLAREYKLLDKIHENVAVQTEFASKVLETTLKGAVDSATIARQSTAEAVKIIQDRVKESLEEVCGSVGRNKTA